MTSGEETAETDGERRRGRPRNPAIDDAALAAARELLAETGWDQTTMVAIAERAGVGKPALYRRWPSKTHLVFEAIFGWVDDAPPVADAADPAEWIRRSCAYTLELFGRPEVKAALPGLLAAFRDREDLLTTLWTDFGGPGVGMLADTMRQDGSDDKGPGERDAAALDAQATMLFIVGGSMVLRLLMADDAAESIADRMPDILLGGVAGRPPAR
ncbi:TetR/AcrR family transcriptional regulator [Rhodococcus maanshanensis]|uniref:DNA-binding transcriptional regulator, AcrR family n=1 Tax=Rhodococcus maanshanensis TaxID=183556 RepID=A0A1H7UV10_9NOCA|nr:TetR/AcrR family transcriptional regulator [Rhodococcus maanshanensis]SEM00803.1 DNA-binding transcriptional regulator, AcrR family [Rhodococcus maanshanensis]